MPNIAETKVEEILKYVPVNLRNLSEFDEIDPKNINNTDIDTIENTVNMKHKNIN